MKFNTKFNTVPLFKPFGILIGSFAGIATLTATATAIAAPSSVLNPCPRIYYEEPHNSRRAAPQGCPPNEATRLLN